MGDTNVQSADLDSTTTEKVYDESKTMPIDDTPIEVLTSDRINDAKEPPLKAEEILLNTEKPSLNPEEAPFEPETVDKDQKTVSVDVDKDTAPNNGTVQKNETETKSKENKDTANRQEEDPDMKRAKVGSNLKGGSPLTKKFPATLDAFGYEFNEDGKLVDIVTGDDFKFDVTTSHAFNQKRYEALGEVIDQHVYLLLEKKAKLQRIFLPLDAEVKEPVSFIFASEDYLTNEKMLTLLIHGSGVVRAGQWARRLIINDNLASGTQLPYIENLKNMGSAVLVLNTNYNRVGFERIRGSESPIHHTIYVWNKIVKAAKAKQIAIIAHSFGGVCTVELFEKPVGCLDKVFAIAFTDSVHSMSNHRLRPPYANHLVKVARNWVTSSEELGARLRYSPDEVPRYSAGTNSHELTSHMSRKLIMKFLRERYAKATGTELSPDEEEASDAEEVLSDEEEVVSDNEEVVSDEVEVQEQVSKKEEL